jgi:hypothetical protein
MVVTVLTSLTDYGYAGHFNNPDDVEDDLNFGATQELFFYFGNRRFNSKSI